MILVSKHMFLCMEHPVLGSTIKCYMAAILKFKMAAFNINIISLFTSFCWHDIYLKYKESKDLKKSVYVTTIFIFMLIKWKYKIKSFIYNQHNMYICM